MAKNINKFQNLIPNTAVVDLIDLITEKLPLFHKSEEYQENTQIYKNENSISEGFCVFMLNQSAQTSYRFVSESGQSGNSKVDFGVYYGAVLFFSIEAKLLPTPKKTDRDEHEYVYTNSGSGGIKRFKDLKHGLNKALKPLTESAMLGYIVEKNFTHWHTKVDQWIANAGWPNTEKLTKKGKFGKRTAVLESTHTRTDGSNIKLTHFWVKL